MKSLITISKRFTIFLIVFLSLTYSVNGSWNDNLTFRGYFRETPILWKPSPFLFSGDDRRFDNLLHARQNLRYYASGNFTFGLEIKTRFYAGESAQLIKSSSDFTAFGTTYFDWETDFIDEENYVLNSAIDRAWGKYFYKTFELTVGRQRVAWGTNLVWNPIDIFNPTSPLDFDNEEMPGTDAVRAQYYLGSNSLIEMAIAPQDDFDSSTIALLIKTNRWEYDWIIMGGRRGYETVWGFAWAGSFWDGGFRGEALYSVPMQDALFTNENVTIAVSGDYTFSNSLYLHSGVLYNDLGTTENSGGFALFYSYLRGWLSPSRISLFGQIAKDITPLIRADISGILNPYDDSWYLGPSVTWSAMTDLDITFSGLIFGGDEFTEFGDNGQILMLRAKYSY